MIQGILSDNYACGRCKVEKASREYVGDPQNTAGIPWIRWESQEYLVHIYEYTWRVPVCHTQLMLFHSFTILKPISLSKQYRYIKNRSHTVVLYIKYEYPNIDQLLCTLHKWVEFLILNKKYNAKVSNRKKIENWKLSNFEL